MKKFKWYILLVFALILMSAASYLLQIAIFHRTEDTFFYMLQDIAFIPIQVLIVTLIINELLTRREKLSRLKKLNMIIGVFFSEVGTPLLQHLSEFDHKYEEIRKYLLLTNEWTARDFSTKIRHIKSHHCKVDPNKGNLANLQTFLINKRPFMLTLMENPNLLEHESFTDLLWAVFHLIEELLVRKNVTSAVDADLQHLADDIKRAHVLLLTEWLAYMRHLKTDYSALFSYAIRTNPFDPHASPEIKG